MTAYSWVMRRHAFLMASQLPGAVFLRIAAFPPDSSVIDAWQGEGFRLLGGIWLPDGKRRKPTFCAAYALEEGCPEVSVRALELAENAGKNLPRSEIDWLRKQILPNNLIFTNGIERWLTWLWWRLPTGLQHASLGPTKKGTRIMPPGAFHQESADAIQQFLLPANAIDEFAKDTREAGNRWIYEQVMQGETYPDIIAELKGKPIKWPAIDTPSGIRLAAFRFAERHQLPEPPKRQQGRRKR